MLRTPRMFNFGSSGSKAPPLPKHVPAACSEAPHLQKFWSTIVRSLEQELKDDLKELAKNNTVPGTGIILNRSTLEVFEKREKLYAKLNKELRPYIEKTFRKYCSSGNQTLSGEEAHRFFENFISEGAAALKTVLLFKQYLAKISAEKVKQDMKTSGLHLADCPKAPQWYAAQQAEEAAEEEVQNMLALYDADKDARHIKAVEVLNTKKEDEVDLEEIILGLTLGTKGYTEFSKALGLVVPGLEELRPADVSVLGSADQPPAPKACWM